MAIKCVNTPTCDGRVGWSASPWSQTRNAIAGSRNVAKQVQAGGGGFSAKALAVKGSEVNGGCGEVSKRWYWKHVLTGTGLSGLGFLCI